MSTVIVNGANGNMGKSAVKAIQADETLTLAGVADKDDSLSKIIQSTPTDVVVDLTHPSAVYDNAHTILSHDCHAVIGTTGLQESQLSALDKLATGRNRAMIVCPNFAISAILMMQFSKQAAQLMDRCEIIEYHHDKKADAPSGTAINTAQLIAKSAPNINSEPLTETEIAPGSRGAQTHNIPIHAIRIPGIVANQEVIFGAQGQSLSIRHDTINRDAFMPGLLIAIKATTTKTGLTYGLEHLLNLS